MSRLPKKVVLSNEGVLHNQGLWCVWDRATTSAANGIWCHHLWWLHWLLYGDVLEHNEKMGRSRRKRWEIKNTKSLPERDEQETIKDAATTFGTCWHKALKYNVQSWMEENCISGFWVRNVHQVRGKWRNGNSFHRNSSLCRERDEIAVKIQNKWISEFVQKRLSNVVQHNCETVPYPINTKNRTLKDKGWLLHLQILVNPQQVCQRENQLQTHWSKPKRRRNRIEVHHIRSRCWTGWYTTWEEIRVWILALRKHRKVSV